MRDGWVETTFGEVVVLNPEAAKGMADDDEIVYVDLSSVSAESGISPDLYRGSFGEAPGRARRVIRTQDVLVSTVRPYLRGFALVPEFLDGEIASTGFAVLRAKPSKILPGLVWAIVGTNNFVDYLMDRATGSSYPAVRPEDVASFNFSLPPLVEQKRIVDVVSSVDSYIVALQQQADTARTARNAVLHELLSAGGEDWTESTLGNIAKCAGGTAFPHEFQGGDTGTPFVKVSDMNESGNERFLLSSNNYVSKEAIKSLGARVWPMGTIVFAKVGAALLTEKRRILVKDTIFDNNIMGLVPKASIESHFLYLFMETVKLGDYVQPGAVPSVNNSIVSEIAINLPPLREQKRIVDVVSSMDELIQSTEKAVVDAKKLRSGLLSGLLSGEHEIPASYDSLLGAA